MDHHERELRAALSSPIAAGIFNVIAPSNEIAAGLEQAFPFTGSKIDWRTVRGHLAAGEAEVADERFRRFFAARRNELSGNKMAYYLNDNLTDCVVGGSLFAFERHLDAILSIPAHHYFVAEDFSWCIAYTMEVDADFGWSASTS